ncbi:hypothetical protein [Tsuneonella dongtanensis]|nr:hypothetical protein [Tsuneonella dongtanensis]
MSRDFATSCTDAQTFVIADLHFGDEGTCVEGRRPFRDATEMGDEIERRWNEVVGDDDTVLVLGDVGRRHHALRVGQLKGQIHLIAGNGDDIEGIALRKLFASIAVARWQHGFLFTHIPVHPSQLGKQTINVHGHLHGTRIDDPRYRCVSVEQTEFAPVRLNSLRADWGMKPRSGRSGGAPATVRRVGLGE